MELWQTILIGFGGPSFLIGVLAYLSKTLLTQWLSREVRRQDAELSRNAKSFELELKAKYDLAAEQLKSELQRSASEHQIRFARLHEKRAETIAEAYALLAEILWNLESYVKPMQLVGEPSMEEKKHATLKSIVDFYRFFEKNRIYLPAAACDALSAFIGQIKQLFFEFSVYAFQPLGSGADRDKHKFDMQLKAWELTQGNIPEALRALEDDLRVLLGDPSAAAKRGPVPPPASPEPDR